MRPPRAPRVSSTPIKGGNGTIGYADALAGRRPRRRERSRSATSSSSRHAEGAAAVVDASPLVEGRAANDLAIAIDRTTDRARRLPARARQLPDRLRRVRGRRRRPTLVKGYVTTASATSGQQAAADAAGSAPLSADLAGQGRRPRSTTDQVAPVRPRSGCDPPCVARAAAARQTDRQPHQHATRTAHDMTAAPAPRSPRPSSGPATASFSGHRARRRHR